MFGPPLGTEAQTAAPFGGPGHPPATRRRRPTSRIGFPTAAVEQIWLRCSVVHRRLRSALRRPLIGVATYLMASEHDGVAGSAYGVAALITVAMPVVPWFALRQLRELLD